MNVIDYPVQDIIEQNMMEYGSYIILQRAIPDIRDGLLPVNRRILYTMEREKATKLTKSANIEGAVMKLHPHGSSYGTIVNMAQKDRQQSRFIIGKGNFGQAISRDLQPAASRYTEVKLSELAIEMLSDLNKNLVDFVPNYDGTLKQPEVLPVKYPMIFTKPHNGVALGMASSIPSFNLIEGADAIIKYLSEGKMTLLKPDFASGGDIVNNKDVFKDINLIGRGTVILRGKVDIKENNIIEITEIPFSTTREAIVEKIIDIVKNGKIKEISSVNDLTGLDGTLIEVKCKRGTDVNKVVDLLYHYTPLQSTFSANMNVITNKTPKVMGVWPIIKEWLHWRKETIVRGIRFDIGKMQKELHFFKGLEKVLLDIDKAIEIIRKSKSDEIELNLIDYFKIDEIQAKQVADMKLRNINKDYIIEKVSEISKIEEKIADYEDIAINEKRQEEIIISDMEEMKNKHGVERMTKLVDVNFEKIKAIKKEVEVAPNYPVKLFITKDGYVRKMSLMTDNDPKSHTLKPGDEIKTVYETKNHSELLVFGNDKSCYKIKVSEIEEVNSRQLGIYIPSICEVKEIVGTSVLDDKNKFIIIAYDNSKIAKIALSSFGGNRKKLANSLAKNANILGILTFSDEGKFKYTTTTSKFSIPTSTLEIKERWTQGSYGPRKGLPLSIEMI